MLLNKQALKEFKILYKKRFGEEISDKTAEKVARKLLLLFKVIYKDQKNQQYNKYEPR